MEGQAHRGGKYWFLLLVGLLIGFLGAFGLLGFGNLPDHGARALAQRAYCKSNLSAIGKRIGVWPVEGRSISWPPDIGTLALEAEPRPGDFICPAMSPVGPTWPKDPNQLREAVNRATDYVFIPLSEDAESGLLTAFDLPANHDQEMVNILCADSHVGETLLPGGFLAEIQKTNDFLAVRRGKNR